MGDLVDAGALWLRESDKGTKYLSGTVNGVAVKVFKNKFYEEGGKKPYYKVYVSGEDAAPKPQAPEGGIPPEDEIPF